MILLFSHHSTGSEWSAAYLYSEYLKKPNNVPTPFLRKKRPSSILNGCGPFYESFFWEDPERKINPSLFMEKSSNPEVCQQLPL